MADHRHKRETNARRLNPFQRGRVRAASVAGPLALVTTATAVGLGVLAVDPATRDLIASASADARPTSEARVSGASTSVDRRTEVSRSGDRSRTIRTPKVQTPAQITLTQKATRRAVQNADDRLFTTTDLNLWTVPGDEADKVGEIDGGKKVLVTGRSLYGRVEVVIDGRSRWVTKGYLSAKKPAAGPAGLGGACTNGTSVASGVSPNIVKVHQAVCAAFPEITSYGTFRGDGEHAQGIAVDIMVSGSRGYEVAEFVRAHYAELGVSYLIYSQRIWSVERGGEGWRAMSDRGSATANHYDHVHVTTF